MLKVHLLLAGVASVTLLAFIVTLDRVPIVWGDDVTYASTARALQVDRSGIPSILRDSPGAVDHVAFYGPVFFRVVATSFDWFGLSIRSFRAVSLLGAVLVACAGVAMVAAFGGRGDRRWWAFTLLLLTPEIGTAATDGRMDTLAVGLEILGLAIFVRGLRAARAPALHGAGAGALLAAAALTTPRAFPFAAAFLSTGVVLWGLGDRRRSSWLQFAWAATVLLVALSVWATVSHGGPWQWLRDLTAIGAREDADVALNADARDWAFRFWTALTLVAAGLGSVAWVASRRALSIEPAERVAATVALVVGIITLALTMAAFNLTFRFGTYFALPLFAVIIGLPWGNTGVTARTLVVAMTGLLIIDTAVRTGKYVRVAATWSARDPGAVEDFIRTHVPPGSTVIGPPHSYFYAVERSGSHFSQDSAESWADWARWVRPVEPDAPDSGRREPTAVRFFIWPADETRYPIPEEWTCARTNVVARFEPAASHLGALGVLNFEEGIPLGYPASVLYRLPPTCP